MSNIHADAERLRAMINQQDERIDLLMSEIVQSRNEYKELAKEMQDLVAAYGPSEKPEVIKALVSLGNLCVKHFQRILTSRVVTREITGEQLEELIKKGVIDG